MKNISWKTSTALLLTGTILLISSLVNLLFVKHYLIAVLMLIAAFLNITDGLRRRSIEKSKIQE